jgi:hypothetical protein
MLKMYSYNKKSEDFNNIINEVVAFAAAELQNKTIENKDERLANLNDAIIKYSVSGTRYEGLYEEKGVECFKDPRVQKSNDVLENFNAIIAEIINPILPMVSNEDFIRFFADVKQIGWGDTARFIVHSNELYKVNEIAEGALRGTMQIIHDDELVINTRNIEITTEVDFYQVASLGFDFGDFGLRAARSFEQYIFLKVVAALASATDVNGAAYTAAGFSKANWSAIAQKVSAANGGSPVWAIGSLGALNNVVPAESGLQMGLGQRLADEGFLEKFMGVRLVCLEPAFATPYGVNTNGDLAFADDEIYFIAVGAHKPIGIVYEGDTIVVERDYTHTPDKTYRIKIGMRVGVGAILGSKFGLLSLN